MILYVVGPMKSLILQGVPKRSNFMVFYLADFEQTSLMCEIHKVKKVELCLIKSNNFL